MLDCTQSAYWQPVLAYVLPPVGALLSATALLVASKARITSQDALVTSAAVARRSDTEPRSRARNASRPGAVDRRKS